ncbi:MAG: response regulator [Gammaproteobacteria bacterium]|nr:response regulator [Gammaproteobacteria bacterium]NIR85500.1 response regulator [Gammaproteobacteria bacterium]NIR89552.1 response regulator [Gammaproteobacteria bacterium]NIU06637.1 response regulator [Gammaproteobacteria bacterium]NIV53520.1 response regulator [Gammaproteobacteria bacterium]
MERVLLVDDHDIVRAGIRRLLEETGTAEVVAEAGSGKEALALAQVSRPDVILMDVNMPGMSGLETTRRLLRIDPDFKIVVVSVHVGGPFPARMLEAGVVAYLTKGCDVGEIVHAIRLARSGQRYVSADVAQRMVLNQFDTQGTPTHTLTPRELEIMVMISQGRANREIAEKLCLSPKTVSTYRSRILSKLEVTTNVELTILALRNGLIEPDAL